MTVEMLLAAHRGDRDEIERKNANSRRSKRSRSLTISALTDAADVVIIYRRRRNDLVAIKKFHSFDEKRDTKACARFLFH